MSSNDDRIKRDHVITVRGKKDKFYVVWKIIKDDVEIEIEWDRWITLSDEDKKNL